MSTLFDSGNLVGYFGLALIIFVGFRVGRGGQLGGWLIAMGASFFLLSQLFSSYIAPSLAEAVLVSFSRPTIIAISTLPVVTLTLGFVLIPLGLVVLGLREIKEGQSAGTLSLEK